jgi:hypothetical protein
LEGLWDGVVLCRLLNALSPGLVSNALKAGDPQLPAQRPDQALCSHNYSAFRIGRAHGVS